MRTSSGSDFGLAPMHMYSDLAPWFHLLTRPSDYWDEAAFVTRVVDEVAIGNATTLLELGSGGGNNASHLKARFTCTLTDLSADMLALSRKPRPGELERLVKYVEGGGARKDPKKALADVFWMLVNSPEFCLNH